MIDGDYNLGVITEYLEDSIIVRPMIVIGNTGYNNFEIKLSEEEIKRYKNDEKFSDEALLLAYDNNKNIINLD